MICSSSICHKGNLKKSPPLAGNFWDHFNQWRRRFFVLYDEALDSKSSQDGNISKERFLAYYESEQAFESGAKDKGRIKINDCRAVKRLDRALFNKDNLISLATSPTSRHSGRIFMLSAATAQEREEWFLALQKSLQWTTKNEVRETCDVYVPQQATKLQIQLEEVKRKREMEKGITTPNCNSDWETTKDMLPNRNSATSSGYESTFSRDSKCSQFSRCSFSSQGMSIEERDIFTYPETFAGPRISTLRRQNKSCSMGNLLKATEHDETADTKTRTSTLYPIIKETCCSEETKGSEDAEETKNQNVGDTGRSWSDPYS